MLLPEPGQTFHSRYNVLRVLGRGGFATVFLASESASQRQVALKVLHPGPDGYPDEMRARFQREARIVANLRDPHSVTLYDFGEEAGGLLFMVFEYVPGRDLQQVVRENGPQEPRIVTHVVRQVLQGLREAHELDLLHRDIKPENIRVFRYLDDPWTVKLLDFGVARPVEGGGEDRITAVGAIVGTPAFMAPEQIFGAELTPACDIYSLGLVAFELLTGRPAVSGHGHHEVMRAQVAREPKRLPPTLPIDPELRSIFERMIERQPEDRFQSAREVLEALALYEASRFGGSADISRERFGDHSGTHSLASRAMAQPAPPGPVIPHQTPAPLPHPPRHTTGPASSSTVVETAPPTDRDSLSTGNLLVALLGMLVAGGAVIGVLQWLSAEPEIEPPAVETSQAEPAPAEVEEQPAEVSPVALRQALAAARGASENAIEAALISAGGCVPDRSDGTAPYEIQIDGIAREAVVDAHPAVEAGRRPVLLLLHDTRHLKSGEFLAETGLATLAAQRGFVVIRPRSKSGPRPVPEFLMKPDTMTQWSHSWADATDNAFLHRLVEEVTEAHCGDPERLFLVGEGAGAKMALQLACQIPSAGVMIDGHRLDVERLECAGDLRAPLLQVEGRRNFWAPIDGGPNCKNEPRISFARHTEILADFYDCSGRPRDVERFDRFDCEVRTSCDAPLEICTHPDGHGWPGIRVDLLYEANFTGCVGPAPRAPMADLFADFVDRMSPKRER